MTIVKRLVHAGCDGVIVGGFGGGPLGGLIAASVTVYHDDASRTVAECMAALLGEGLPEIDPRQACRGH